MAELIKGPDFASMTIGQLRQYASHARMALDKTATKEDIIIALNKKLGDRSMPELAHAESTVKPGYSKIRVLSDPMPGASNLPIFVGCNGYNCLIPRDVDVIVPHRVVRTLRDALQIVKKQMSTQDQYGREVFKNVEVKVPSYPFQELESVPGPEQLTSWEMAKLRTIRPRERYRDLFGHWPNGRELIRAIEQKLISLDPEETLSASDAAQVGVDENILS